MKELSEMTTEEKQKLAESMVCNHDHAPRKGADITQEIMMKSRAVGATTMTLAQINQSLEQLQKLSMGLVPVQELTEEQILAKREAAKIESTRKRQTRKTVRNNALAVATSKRARRRIARGATALELTSPVSTLSAGSVKRARTLRREATRNMAKLSRKFATKPVAPTPPLATE